MLCCCFIHLDHALCELCDSGVLKGENLLLFFVFLVGQVSGLTEKLNIAIFSDAINGINVKLCMMVLHIELYLFVILLVSLTLFQAHSSVSFN